MTQAIIPQAQSSITNSKPIDSALDVLLYSLSDTSKRQYEHTFKKWATFCGDQGIAPNQMTAQNMINFLEQDNLSHSTKQARLSHMRKLLETMHAQEPDNKKIESMYKQAKLLKIKRTDHQTNEREKHALNAGDIFKSFAVFSDNTKLHTRNRALLAILFYGGLRRAEAADLKWSDIDLEEGLITVRHGKGDKARTIPLLGGLKYLREWRTRMPDSDFVFCAFYKGDVPRQDKPMTTKSIYMIIKALEADLDIEGLSPHDARRTLITSLLNQGASVADVQFLAGHANPQTTLGYAVVKDAKEVKGRLSGKLNY